MSSACLRRRAMLGFSSAGFCAGAAVIAGSFSRQVGVPSAPHPSDVEGHDRHAPKRDKAAPGNERAVTMPTVWKATQARTTAANLGSHTHREHEHFAVADLIFCKHIRTGFRLYLDFGVGKAGFDGLQGLGFIGNGDKKLFPAHRATGASAGPHGADLPTLGHGS